ncbi:hypothetical protein [Psychrobacter urativorans]|uniref:hypothetical protein n=1 Tax=Psychrobacter urativorans TaxID=45610 RepID=UPI00191B75D3|nr:hypothetical protein [Psychrobacter urativorans]
MPAIATTHSLNDYRKLVISNYRDQLRNSSAKSIEFSYTHRSKPYQYSIQLSKISCNYGGHRYWWLCPKCNQRTSTLYYAGLYVCRHCIGANYGSQLQQPIDRIYSKLNAIRAHMGWQVGVIHGIGERPKGMHAKTYNRLLKEYEHLEQKIIGAHYATT